MITATCNLCAHATADIVPRAVPANAPSSGIDIVRCRGCGLLYAHPMPGPDALLTRYGDDYFHCPTPIEGGYEDYRADEPLIRKTFRLRLPLFLPEVSVDARAVLDVGCATGAFLEVMRERGWTATGIEVSPAVRDTARAKGFAVTEKTLEQAGFAPASFDLITMWDVIEHLHDPLSALKACHQLLKPGGVIVITTPDASAPFARLTGKRWMGFRSVGEHVYFFGRKSIRAYLAAAGFEARRVTSVGKFFSAERLLTRLVYYTRVFRLLRPLQAALRMPVDLYVNSGDTMCAVGRKPI